MIPKYRDSLNFVYGSIAGVIGTALLYPTYLLKRVLQANSGKDFQIGVYVKDMYARQGIRAFYQGMSMTFLKVVPYQGLLFWGNEKLKYLIGYYN